MRLTSEQAYPPGPKWLFAALTDFDALEALFAGAGAEVLDRAPGAADGQGRGWTLRAQLKGMTRTVAVRVLDVTPQTGFRVEAKLDALTVVVDVAFSFSASGKGGTVTCRAQVTGHGIAGRLMLSSLSFAQSTIETKFHNRMVSYTRSRIQARRAAEAQGQ